ncbi:MAG: InlB B-repeat-containing protein, partial [Oscillospiraceae bacterium]|nr:InlB B-repeat-containing protein [Oscillospiraceae bacterium]
TLSRDVTWSITGQNDVGTTINSVTGEITIAASETSDLIVVTATSVANPVFSTTIDVTFEIIIQVVFNGNGGLPANYTIGFASGQTVGSVAPTVTRANHTFAGWWTTPAVGGVQRPNSFALTAPTTLYARWTPVGTGTPQPPQPPPQPWQPPIGGGSSSYRDDRGSGGGSGISRILSALTPATTERWLTANDVAALPRAQDGSVRSTHGGRLGVRGNAWSSFGFAYTHDTTDREGVQVRVSLGDPRAMTGDVLVSAWVTGNDVNRVRNLFERFFSNDLRVVHFDYSGGWGQTVRVAARVDLAGMDVENLYFYNFDREANTFRLIAEPNYRVDGNGFLHFNTTQGGSVIISEGPLARR